MQSEDTDGIAAYLTGVAAAANSARGVADAVEVTLAGIEQVLAPIVGSLGVAALYRRSVHLARGSYDWLPDLPTDTTRTIDVGPLSAALAQRSPAEAAAAAARLLGEFRTLLVTFIGPSLTERLRRSVWINFLSGASAQDNTQ